MNQTREITTCRSCGNNTLHPIFSLGNLYVSNFLDRADADFQKQPLDLVLCDTSNGGCGLLQLKHTVSPHQMYRNYWYRSGVNKSMTEELARIADTAEDIAGLCSGDIVVDIGCNDGTLLRAYRTQGIERVGFEPAENLILYAQEGTSKIFNDFFSAGPLRDAFGPRQAKIITAIAMFYDLDDPNAFVGDIKQSLDPEGVFIIQMSYLPSMLLQNAFDNICHEHLEFYAMGSLEFLLKRHGLEACDVEQNDVNGGSFRMYIRHAGSGRALRLRPGGRERVEGLRANEQAMLLHQRGAYDAFVRRVEEVKKRVCEYIRGETAKGKKVYVYGASTKGNTLLQYFGLDASLIAAAAERNPAKWGKKTIGTNIPIVSEEQARSEKPDYFLILPWHFLPEFLERESEFRQAGGKFIVPLPEFRVI